MCLWPACDIESGCACVHVCVCYTGEHQAEEWFADLGLPPYIIEAVIGRYGPEDAKARIKDDPYTALLDMPNFDFE